MYSGFCVRVLVLSLLTFGQHANAFGYRSEGSSGIKPLFDYPRNHKLASDFESSAQPGGFLGSYGSRHGEGGRVERYSPKGSVSSYGSGSVNIRKLAQNSRQPPQTNPIQTKVDMWDLVLPQNGKRVDSGIASSKAIIMQAGPQPSSQHQQSSYQQSRYQQPGSQPVGLQSKPAMREFFSPIGGVSGPDVQPANLNLHMTVPPRTRPVPMSSPHRPRWQRSLVPV